MRIALIAIALLGAAALAAPPAEAKGKKAKAPKGSHLYDNHWGRRSDITVRWWTPRLHPYTRFD
jgi:hypothetical protein